MRITRPRPLLTAALAGTLAFGALAGCSAAATDTTTTSESATGADTSTTTSEVALDVTEALADNKDYTETAALADETWETADEVAITLDGDTASASGDGVTVDGSTVTITAPGTYRISGTLSDGQVVVSSAVDGVVRIVLDDAHITSSTTSAIAVMEADKVSVVLADGTENSLEDASSYVYADGEDEPNAALFSTADLVISGGGSLDVTGSSNDGIASKDELVIAGGTITATAVDDGVRGKDYVVVTGGTLDVTAGGDGIKSHNEDGTDDDGDTVGYAAFLGGDVTVSAGDDGVHAESDLVIADGTLTVTEAVEGLEGAHILVAGGTTDVTASDDGLNAAGATSTTTDDAATDDTTDDTTTDGASATTDDTTTAENAAAAAPPDGGPGGGGGGGGMGGEAAGDFSLAITGGTLTVDAGGDGLDSNGTFTMTGGDVTVFGPTNDGNGALDSQGAFTVDGGTLLAVGSAGMAQTPDAESAQGWVGATFDTLSAGTVLQLTDADGTVIAEVTLTKDTQSVVFSGADVEDGATYTVVADGSEVTTATAGEAVAGGMGGGMRP